MKRYIVANRAGGQLVPEKFNNLEAAEKDCLKHEGSWIIREFWNENKQCWSFDMDISYCMNGELWNMERT